jgi:uncharacterized protein (TIGR02145 family)
MNPVKAILCFLFASLSIFVLAQVKDQEGNQYKTIKIGTQTWMAQNLNVGKFRNGDPIPEAKSAEEWLQAAAEGKPAWCYYNNDPANGNNYGRLYNWFAITDPRGLAPKGWHIPTDEEWQQLVDMAGGDKTAGTALKSKADWKDKAFEDPHNFNGLPGGARNSAGEFSSLTTHGHHWTSTPVKKSGWSRGLSAAFAFVGHHDSNYPGSGLSVRCIKD